DLEGGAVGDVLGEGRHQERQHERDLPDDLAGQRPGHDHARAGPGPAPRHRRHHARDRDQLRQQQAPPALPDPLTIRGKTTPTDFDDRSEPRYHVMSKKNKAHGAVLGVYVAPETIEAVLLRKGEHGAEIVQRFVRQRASKSEMVHSKELALALPGLKTADDADYTLEVGDGSA